MTRFDDEAGVRLGNLERHEQAREILLHGAAGQAVVAVVHHAGLASVRVTDTHSEVRASSVASRVVEDWGRPRASTDPDFPAPPISTDVAPSEVAESEFHESLAFGIIRGEAMTGLASAVAGNIFRRSIDLPTVDDGVPDQVAELMDLVDGSEDEVDKLVAQWTIDTDNTLRDYWSGVERVAEALRSGDSLDEDDVKELVGLIDGDPVEGDDEDEDADLSPSQEEAVERFASIVIQLQDEERQASQRFNDLHEGERPDPGESAEVTFELVEVRKRQEAVRDVVNDMPRKVRDEVWRRVEGQGADG